MTRPLTQMAPWSELMLTALRAATHPVVEGSRRNAREALEARGELARQNADALTVLAEHRGLAAVPSPRRPSAS